MVCILFEVLGCLFVLDLTCCAGWLCLALAGVFCLFVCELSFEFRFLVSSFVVVIAWICGCGVFVLM